MESHLLFKEITTLLQNNGGENLVTVDLCNKSGVADYIIIVTGTSNRHSITLAEKSITLLKKHNIKNIRVDGLQVANWIAIDCGKLVLHIFLEEVREYYAIEKIWQ